MRPVSMTQRLSRLMVVAIAFSLLVPSVVFSVPREAILGRAERWIVARTPYSMSRYAHASGTLVSASASRPSTLGWRTDCSGYVSMSIGLLRTDGTPLSLDTATLPLRMNRISKDQLRPGDIILRSKNAVVNGQRVPYGHAVIFVRWIDAEKKRYVGYHESSSSGKAVATAITYPFGTAPGFAPYRYRAVEEVRLRKSRTWYGGVVLQPQGLGAYDIIEATGAPSVSAIDTFVPTP